MRILQEDLVVDFYGEWPSFHDAEILKVELSRGRVAGQYSNLRVHINYATFKRVSDDPLSDFVRDTDKVIIIDFYQVEDVELDGFNYQNVIFELKISESSEFMEVVFEPSFGMQLNFKCKDIAVISVSDKVEG